MIVKKNSFFQHLKKCIEETIEKRHNDVRVQRVLGIHVRVTNLFALEVGGGERARRHLPEEAVERKNTPD